MKMQFKVKALALMVIILSLITACAEDNIPKDPIASKATGTTAPVQKTNAPTALVTEAPTEVPPTEDPSKPVTVPEPYFEMKLDGNNIVDGKNNVSIEIIGGSVSEYEFIHNNKTYKRNAYCGYEVNDWLKLTFDDYLEWNEFIMEGATFEVLYQVEKISTSNAPLFSNGNSGGFSLNIRGQNAIPNFNMGTTDISTADYGTAVYSYARHTSEGDSAESGVVVHLVGMYDKKDSKLRLYYNGEFVSEGYFGDGIFLIGKANQNQLGLGGNSALENETMVAASGGSYGILRARVYNKALSGREVAKAYSDSIDFLTEGN